MLVRSRWMGTDERRSGRANVILTATIEKGSARIPVRVSNLSEHGALVIGDGLPAGETQIVFRCNGAAVQSWVAWSRDGRAGIQFGNPVQADALTQRESVPRLAIIKDTRELDFRRPGFRGNQMTDEERKIVAEWNRPPPKQSEGEEPSSEA
jgi:hypothetical protein